MQAISLFPLSLLPFNYLPLDSSRAEHPSTAFPQSCPRFSCTLLPLIPPFFLPPVFSSLLCSSHLSPFHHLNSSIPLSEMNRGVAAALVSPCCSWSLFLSVSQHIPSLPLSLFHTHTHTGAHYNRIIKKQNKASCRRYTFVSDHTPFYNNKKYFWTYGSEWKPQLWNVTDLPQFKWQRQRNLASKTPTCVPIAVVTASILKSWLCQYCWLVTHIINTRVGVRVL